ncbi:MAG: KH domain-containing protein [Armatimonadota bacterium]
MLREFLEASVRALVDDHDAIRIEEERNGSRLRYRIYVAEADRGRVIGKNGRIINALRTVGQAVGGKNRMRVQIFVITEDKQPAATDTEQEE